MIDITDEEKIEQLKNFMREERDKRLLECDWTQTLDNKLSDDKKNEWMIYRQALRDLPATLNIDPSDTYVKTYNAVHWPTPPQ
tara:strand:- start:50 stop:298 length:249 start_codon:yes stop_codon:yes gene_type:complete